MRSPKSTPTASARSTVRIPIRKNSQHLKSSRNGIAGAFSCPFEDRFPPDRGCRGGGLCFGICLPKARGTQDDKCSGKRTRTPSAGNSAPCFQGEKSPQVRHFSADFTEKQRNFYGRNDDSAPFWIGVEAWGRAVGKGIVLPPKMGVFAPKSPKTDPSIY